MLVYGRFSSAAIIASVLDDLKDELGLLYILSLTSV